MMVEKPLCFVSHLDPTTDKDLVDFILQNRIPVILDPFNHVEVKRSLRELAVIDVQISSTEFDSVFKLGRTPTSRLWRDLSRNPKLFNKPVYTLAEDPFPGCARTVFRIERKKLRLVRIMNYGNIVKKPLPKIGPRSEHSFLANILARFSDRVLFLGNSLLAYMAQYLDHYNHTIFGNRGANGIDGLVSTFAGICLENKSAVGVIGDLSFFYDIPGLTILRQIKGDWRLFVFNNRGGRIFSYLRLDFNVPNAAKFMLSQVNANISQVCRAFKIKFHSATSEKDLVNSPPRSVIEVIPNSASTKMTWRRILSL